MHVENISQFSNLLSHPYDISRTNRFRISRTDNSEISKNSQDLRFQIIFTYPLKNI